MDEQALKLPSAVEGFERFLLDACEERGRVMEEIAVTRRRIAEVDAQLARSSDTEVHLARMAIDAQRVVREERRANERAVATIRADGEARAARIMGAAREQVAATAGVAAGHGPRRYRRTRPGVVPCPGAKVTDGPSRVAADVVAAADVDPVLWDMNSELLDLRRQLGELRETLGQRERQLAEVRHGARAASAP